MSHPPQTSSPEWVLNLKPYVPGKPIEELERELGITGSIKLASNENPLGPSPAAIEAAREAATKVHLYPDAGTFKLRAKIAEKFGLKESRIIVGNGSNELITLVVRAFCTPSHNAVFGDRAFIAYRVVTGAAGVQQRVVPMPGLKHDVDAMIEACDENTQVLFLANPNNPTGTYNNADEVRRLLERVPEHVMVVMDEAYTEYVDADDYPNALELVDTRQNLIVMRTFSKAYGLAGFRVGFACVPEFASDRIGRIREPFNVGLVAQAAATAALDDDEFIRRTVEMNRTVRQALYDGLGRLGIEYIETQTNFVLMKSPIGGPKLYQRLLQQGVIVRPLQPYGMMDHVRVSVGTPEENQRFLDTLPRVLAEEA